MVTCLILGKVLPAMDSRALDCQRNQSNQGRLGPLITEERGAQAVVSPVAKSPPHTVAGAILETLLPQATAFAGCVELLHRHVAEHRHSSQFVLAGRG